MEPDARKAESGLRAREVIPSLWWRRVLGIVVDWLERSWMARDVSDELAETRYFPSRRSKITEQKEGPLLLCASLSFRALFFMIVPVVASPLSCGGLDLVGRATKFWRAFKRKRLAGTRSL